MTSPRLQQLLTPLCLPILVGLTLASDRERLEKVIRRAKRLVYLEVSLPTVSELANITDAKLYPSILNNPKHVLYQVLPPLRFHSTHQLRPRVHNHYPHSPTQEWLSIYLKLIIYKDV